MQDGIRSFLTGKHGASPSSMATSVPARLRRVENRPASSWGRDSGLAGLASRLRRKARQGPRAVAIAVVHRLSPRPLISKGIRAITRERSARRISAQRWGGGPVQCPCVPGLVSVVLPVYNQADLLTDSIESVLDQTYGDLELIVVNDGSADGVEPVLARYLNHPKVRVLTQPNQKLPKALSNGFEFARGEFWTWTSADNLMHPEQLARQVGFLREHPETSMVYADYRAIDDRGRPLEDLSFRPRDRRPPTSSEIHLPRDPRLINIEQNNFIGPCFLYRAVVGRAIGEYDPNLGLEDYDYWMRVNHAFVIAHLGTDDLLYSYRVHDRSLSGRAAELKIAERARLLMEYERDRQAFYRRPWVLVLDAAMKVQLAGCIPPSAQLEEFRNAPRSESPIGHEPEKVLYLIDSANLETLAAGERSPMSRVAAWFESVDDAYERWHAAARCGAVAITDQSAVAERLDLLGVNAFVVGSRPSVVELARIHANNRAFLEQTRPESLRLRSLPVPVRPAEPDNVLIQVDDFDRGGMENMILLLAEGLRRRGINISLLVLGRLGPAADRARTSGIRVLTLPQDRRDDAYRALLRERGVKLVNAHYSTYGAAIVAEMGIPFVQVVHNAYVWLDDRAVAKYRQADAHTSAYLCVSAQVARYSDSALGLSAAKMVVVPNGIDGNRLEAARCRPPGPLRDELGLSGEDFVFLNVASIHATKAQKALVLAFARVIREHPRSRLLIVGPASDHDYEAQLRRTIARSGLERSVILTGQRDDVARFYWMADAFVLPSYWEGWSLALTEAAYAGLPTVATDVGGARELLTEASGRLVRPPFGAISELNAGSIGRLVHGEDPRFVAELAESMGELAASRRRTVPPDSSKKASLDQERMVELHFTILSWIIAGGHAGSARAWSRAKILGSW
jgi:glycosyltransferase involved in cell wall biosynthesis